MTPARGGPFATGTLVHPPIFRIGPPYERFELLRELSRIDPAEIEPGSVWLVAVLDTPNGWRDAAEWVPRLRWAYRSVAVGLLLPPDVDPGAFDAVHGGGFPRVRAVLREREPVAAMLRDRMTRPAGLGTEIIDWLALHGVLLRPRVAARVRLLLDGGDRSLDEVLGTMNLSGRTLRRIFASSGLPPPREWHAVARALRAVLRLQGEPGTALLRIAHDAAYGDHSSLSRQLRWLFGLRSGEIRPTLGWEWVLGRWVGGWAGFGGREVDL